MHPASIAAADPAGRPDAGTAAPVPQYARVNWPLAGLMMAGAYAAGLRIAQQMTARIITDAEALIP
jgi:hypothetical protein